MVIKRIKNAGILLTAFMLTSYLANVLYGDFFFVSQGKRTLFFLWGLPCLHFVVVCTQLFSMLFSIRYPTRRDFVVEKITPLILPLIELPIAVRRYFITINFNDRLRVFNGIFWRKPDSILFYNDFFGKAKVFSTFVVLVRLIGVLSNLVVLTILRLMIL